MCLETGPYCVAQADLKVGLVALPATDLPSSASRVLRCVAQRVPRHTEGRGEYTREFACMHLKPPTAGCSQALGRRGIE